NIRVTLEDLESSDSKNGPTSETPIEGEPLASDSHEDELVDQQDEGDELVDQDDEGDELVDQDDEGDELVDQDDEGDELADQDDEAGPVSKRREDGDESNNRSAPEDSVSSLRDLLPPRTTARSQRVARRDADQEGGTRPRPRNANDQPSRRVPAQRGA